MPERLAALLRTKLHRPRITSDLILRPALLDQLNEGVDRWLTLVCAPAGFGKTTLINLWIESLISKPDPMPVAWLYLDKDDSDIARFSQYLIGSLRTVFKDACSETEQLIKGPHLPPVPQFSTILCNEIELFPERFILVLDDYHTIQGSVVHNLLNDLLQHWPYPMHLVILTRNNPPLPLPKLRVNGKITEIRTIELRFHRTETAAFLNKQLKTPLSDRAIDILDEKTEGWIGALRLATLSLQSATNVNDRIMNMTGSYGNIAEYLADEVFEHQFRAIQTFLKKTSVLDRFCVPLCEAIISELDPAWDVRACIDWIVNEGLFVIPLDDNQDWYRYHHLFQDYLKGRAVVELGPAEIANLHRQAATWYFQQGLIDQAIHHSQEAGDLELLAHLLYTSLGEMLNREDRLALDRYLQLLPDDFVQKRPDLLIIKAWVYQFTWQLEAQEKVTQKIEMLLESGHGNYLSADEIEKLGAMVAAMKAQYAYFRIQPEEVPAYCQKVLASFPESWMYLRGVAMLFLGLGLQTMGESQAAERLLLDEYEALNNKADGFALRLLLSLCFIYLNHTSFDKVYQTAQLLLTQAEIGKLPILQGWAHFFLGVVLYQWNQLEAAEKHFTYLTEHLYSIQVLSAREGIIGRALIHQSRDEREDAMRMANLLSRIDLERSGVEADQASSLRARFRFLDGDLDPALRWADGYTVAPASQLGFWLEFPHLTQVRILIGRKLPEDLHQAHQVLDALEDIAKRTYNTRVEIAVLAVRALAFDAQGNLAAALETLQQALDLARPGGLVRVFVDLGPSMLSLLEELAGRGYLPDMIERIITAFPGRETIRQENENRMNPVRPASTNESTVLAESLTTREREILINLREPISLKEVASKLSVSYATLKRHTINIYGKLGVHSRWEAVDKATEYGLLSVR